MSLTVLALLLLLLISFGNGYNNTSTEFPFHISYSRTNNQILEFPSLPVSEELILNDIDCKSQVLYLSDPQNCLTSLFLTNNFSLFYPFRPYDSSSNNITFFNCSSVGQHHLKSRNAYLDAQDMLSCPIYAADSTESVIDLDLLCCTRMFDKVLPIEASDIRQNKLQLSWLGTNFQSQCLELHNKSKKNKTIIILETIGE
jgi:hypothetical protein